MSHTHLVMNRFVRGVVVIVAREAHSSSELLSPAAADTYINYQPILREFPLEGLHEGTYARSQQQLIERSLPVVEGLPQHQRAHVRVLALLNVDDAELLARVLELQRKKAKFSVRSQKISRAIGNSQAPQVFARARARRIHKFASFKLCAHIILLL